MLSQNKLPLVAAAIFVLTASMACRGSTAVSQTPTINETLTIGETPTVAETPEVYQIGIFEDLTTTNYWSFLGSGADGTIWNAYVLGGGPPALFTYSDQRFDWIPSLAAQLPPPVQEESIGGQTFWTTEVDLKQGVKWSDGTEVTAEDFVFTSQTVLDLQLPGNWAAVVNPEYFDHAEALGPYKLKIFFKKEPGLSIWQFGTAFMPILPKSYWEPVVAEAKQQGNISDQQKSLFAHIPENEPSAGGFIFNKWEKGAFVEKVKNPDYFFTGSTVTEYTNGAYAESKADVYEFSAYGEPAGEETLEYTVGPHADSVIYSIYSNQESAVLALKTGEIDYILNPIGLQTGLQDQVRDEPGIGLVENPSNGIRYLAFNFHKSPTDNKAFRHAVATLIDKEFLTSTVLQGVAIPAYTTVPEGNEFWYNPDVPLIGKGLTRAERVAQAVRLLKDAGFTWEVEPKVSADGNFMEVRGEGLRMPNGEPMRQLNMLAPSAGYDPLRSTFAIWIERWLNDVGIPVRANLTGFNIIVETINDPEAFDMFILGWSLTLYPDYLESFFHSRHTVEGGLNRGGYSNPEFDALADGLLEETNLEEARQKVFRMQEFLADDLPYVVLFTTPILEAYRSDRLEFPYTEVLDGIQDQNGLTTTVLIK
jgi:ABC-type transport system substrate-binding protein